MPKDNSKPQRERRAREAQERQTARNALTSDQQIIALNLRDAGPAVKERRRLAA